MTCIKYREDRSRRVFFFISEKRFESKKSIRLKTNEAPCYGSLSSFDEKKRKYLYITNFRTEEFKNEVDTIVYYINLITPCILIKKGRTEVIKYESIGYYKADLVLLNFIRLLWKDVKTILKMDSFFSQLAGRNKHNPFAKYNDPLEVLLSHLKKNTIISDNYGYGDHNNIYKNLKIKNTKQLKEFKEGSMENFLTK